MPTLRNDLVRALAEVVARDDLGAANLETLRAGLRLAACLLDVADAERDAIPGLVASLGEAPQPARLARHARVALAAGYRALRSADAGSRDGLHIALGASAEALFQFSHWCRHSGHYALGRLLADASLACWPADFREEQRLWLTYFRATTDAIENPGAGLGPHPLDIAAEVEAQTLAMHRRDLLPIADFLRGFHAANCGRFGEAERIARSIMRRARRSGNRQVEAVGLNLATTAVGRQGRASEAAGFALRLVQVEEAPPFLRILALVNVGLAFQVMGLFEPSLEAYAASLAWHRRLDEYPAVFVRVIVLRQVMDLYALRGDHDGFLNLYRQLGGVPMLPFDRVFFHRDAATGFMRFGEVETALGELANAQSVAERHGYHYDWFAIEAEIQKLRHVHSQGRDVARLEGLDAGLVRSARAAWQTFETDLRILAPSA